MVFFGGTCFSLCDYAFLRSKSNLHKLKLMPLKDKQESAKWITGTVVYSLQTKSQKGNACFRCIFARF